MIISFACDETKKIFEHRRSLRFISFEQSALKKLYILHSAHTLVDLSTPGNRLEKLEGDRKDQYSIRINDKWRLCFEWTGNDASNVEIVDYH